MPPTLQKPWSAVVMACALAAAGCTPLPEVASGVCGNGVLEAGEECDDPGAGCGAAGGPSPCRLICDGAATRCPAGYVCGVDRVCRQPREGFTLSPVIGAPAEGFHLFDWDGDAWPDVLERSVNQITILRNRGDGTFSPSVSGSVPIGPHIDIGRADADARGVSTGPSLIAALTDSGAAVFTARRDGSLLPLLFPTTLIPADAQRQPELPLGVVVFLPGGDGEPLFLDRDGARLVAYPLGLGVVDADATLDLGQCGAVDPSLLLAVAQTTARATTLIGIQTSETGFCVAAADLDERDFEHHFSLQKLAFPDDVFEIDQFPFFGDFDGDGRTDVLAYADQDSALVLWPATAAGYGPPRRYDLDIGAPPTVLPAVADFNGDHRDDLVDCLFHLSSLDAHPPGFTDVLLPSIFGDHCPAFVGAGDVNHDGNADAVGGSSERGEVSVCLGTGAQLRLTCDEVATELSAGAGVTLADLDGDGTLDISTWGAPLANAELPAVASADAGAPTAASDGGVSDALAAVASRLDVIYGRPLAVPDPRFVAASTVGSAIARADRSPSSVNVADDLLVSLTTGAGQVGVTLGQATADGQLAFGFGNNADRVWALPRLLDANDDGLADLALTSTEPSGENVVRLFLGAAGSGISGTPMVILDAPATDEVGFLALPDDAAPAVAWLSDDDPTKPITIARLTHGAAPSYGGAADWLRPTVPDAEKFATVDGFTTYDVDGDGRQELVMQAADSDAGCFVVVGVFPPAGAPPVFRTVAHPAQCSVDDQGAMNVYFAPGAHPSGLWDLYVPVATCDGCLTRTLQRYPPSDDGTYDTTTPLAAPPQLPADAEVSTVVDMNGDGIADVIFKTDQGLFIAFANVLRR